MAIQSLNPHVDAEGNVYPFLKILSLNAAADLSSNRKALVARANLTVGYYRILEDGTHLVALDQHGRPISKSVLVADAYTAAQYDPAVAQLFGGTLHLIGQFTSAKGL
jgi:hypothetical protein